MKWARGETLGHGSFATVTLAKTNDSLMAVKSCGASLSSTLKDEKSILDELNDCHHIIKCFGLNSSFENGEKLCNLWLEYAPGGSLADKLKRERLSEYKIRRYARDILKGIDYIHKKGYVHCDIKPQNILLCSDIAKIGDFGLAKRETSRTELRGTPMYMSPEMAVSGEQGAPADVWAAGCVVAEMASGGPAWRFAAEIDTWRVMMRIGIGDEVPEIRGDLSDDGRDFLEKCFIKDPRMRWTAEMLLNHPFVIDDCDTVALDNYCFLSSPRGPFDFPDSEGEDECESTILPSPGNNTRAKSAERLGTLMFDELPDWSVSDSWVTVRCLEQE